VNYVVEHCGCVWTWWRHAEVSAIKGNDALVVENDKQTCSVIGMNRGSDV
jgi:hypothetical protein